MKILVLSDSHRETKYMELAVLQEQPDHVIHLGDHTADAETLSRIFPKLPLLSVRGNCDLASICQETIITEFCGFRILATHGHRYGVKSGLLRLSLAAAEVQADVVLFGHTHSALCEQKGSLWMFNPGSCGYCSRPSYGIIEMKDGSLSCRLSYFD